MTVRERAVLAFCWRAGCIPDTLGPLVHRFGFFDDIPGEVYGQYCNTGMVQWLKEQPRDTVDIGTTAPHDGGERLSDPPAAPMGG
jgi:hypothetical protein